MELESVSGESLSDVSIHSPVCGFPSQLNDHPHPARGLNGVVQCWTEPKDHDDLQRFIETSSVDMGLPDFYRTSSCYLMCEGDLVERGSVSSPKKTEDQCLGDAVSLLELEGEENDLRSNHSVRIDNLGDCYLTDAFSFTEGEEVPENAKSRRHMKTLSDNGESRSISGISDVPKQLRPLPLKKVSQCWQGALETQGILCSDARESGREDHRCLDRVEELLTPPNHCMEEMEKGASLHQYLQERLQQQEEEEEEEVVLPRTSHLRNFLKRFLCCFPARSSRVSPV